MEGCELNNFCAWKNAKVEQFIFIWGSCTNKRQASGFVEMIWEIAHKKGWNGEMIIKKRCNMYEYLVENKKSKV